MYRTNFFSIAENCMSGTVRECVPSDLDKVFSDERVKQICLQVAALRSKPAATPAEKRANKEEADRLKKQLPVLLPHATFPGKKRCNEGAKPSPWVSMDYDDIDNPKQVWQEVVKAKAMALGCPLAFVSPSGRGLKFLVAMPEGMNHEQAQAWVARYLGMEQYDHTHDLARCCFLVGSDNLLHYDAQLLFQLQIEAPVAANFEPALLPVAATPSDLAVAPKALLPARCESEETLAAEPNYLGIPYARIINKYWELHNAGHTPIVSNRNALTYDLAYHLRSIAGFNRELLNRIIPCYDGFPEAEKLRCIDSALGRPVTGISDKMTKVLEAMKKEYLFDETIFKALEEVEEVNANFDFDQIRKAFEQPEARVKGMPKREIDQLPAGLRHTLNSLPNNLAMPVVVGIAPLFGVLASAVRLNIEGKARALNLQSYVVGGAGSRKSQFDDLYMQWMKPWREEQKVEEAKDEEYEELRRRKKNAKDQPQDPCAQVLELSPRSSTAKILRRLKNARGRMCLTYAQEMDMGSASAGQSWNKDLGVIARCAYDESSYSTDYQNSETGRIIIPNVRWNRILCGTPDALYRSLRNYTDGEITRVGLGSMPCNSFTPYSKIPQRAETIQQEMARMAQLLMKMGGEVELPILEQKGHEWQEKIRIEAIFTDDKVLADQRFRIPTTALRITCGYMLLHLAWWLIEQLDNRKGDLPKWAHGCETAQRYLESHPEAVKKHLPMLQNDGWIRFYEVVCDYMIRTVMLYFRDRITAAYAKDNYVVTDFVTSVDKAGKSNNIFDSLGKQFTLQEALAARGDNKADANRSMVKRWKRQGLVRSIGDCLYEKVA